MPIGFAGSGEVEGRRISIGGGHFTVESTAVNTKQAGGLRLVAGCTLQDINDPFSLVINRRLRLLTIAGRMKKPSET
jgi:hypothetical protein